MPFVKPVDYRRLHSPTLPLPRLTLLCALVAFVCAQPAWSQSSPAKPASQASAPLAKASRPVVLLTKPAGPQWHELSAAQKQILQPLAASWDGLSSGHKGKWIALAASYPSHSPAEQQKMQGRMAEWAALSASQRERARLNFAETQKVPKSQRAAEWEAYQGLSIQEKRLLAAKGRRKLTGAAVAVKPVPPEKITPVPITRHTTQPSGGTPAYKPRIDPYTLLPLPPLAPVSVPASAASTPG